MIRRNQVLNRPMARDRALLSVRLSALQRFFVFASGFGSAERLGPCKGLAILAGACLMAVSWPSEAWAKAAIGKVGALIGEAHIIRGGQMVPAKKGLEVFSTDTLKTAPKAVVKLQFSDGGTIMAFENSIMTIEQYDVKRQGDKISLKSAIDIAKGKVRFFVKPGPNRSNESSFKSKNAVMGIRGTSGFIQTSGEKTQLVVLTGKVELKSPSNPSAAVFVTANQVSEVLGAGAPTKPQAASPQFIRSLSGSVGEGDSSGGAAEDVGGEGEGSKDSDEKKQDNQKKENDKKDQEGKKDSGQKKEPAEKKEEGAQKEQGSKKDQGGNKKQEGSRQGDSGRNGSPGVAEPGQPRDQGSLEPSTGQTADESQRVAPSERPAPGGRENRPAPVKRVVVFGQDGTAGVSVGDASTSSFVAPMAQDAMTQAPPASAAQPNPSGPGPAARVSATRATGASGAMEQVQLATTESQKVQEQIRETVVESLQEATGAIEAAKEVSTPVATSPPAAPKAKSVRVRVVLPKP